MAKLIYLMGASGTGKDTLIMALRKQQESIYEKHHAQSMNKPITIAHRYITREVDKFENHVALSVNEFEYRKQMGLFAMDWQANGLHYGLGIEINYWLEQNQDVLVNGSRAYLEYAKARYQNQLLAVCLTVPESVLKARLLSRGRETKDAIDKRIERAQAFADSLPSYTHFIDNEGEILTAIQKLRSLVKLVDPQTKGLRQTF